MMRPSQLLKEIFNPLQNCEAIVFQFCELLKVPVTKSQVKKQVEEHPNYPSLLAVGDVLDGYGIAHLSVKTEVDQLSALRTPMIAQVSIGRETYFAIINRATENNITYQHPLNGSVITAAPADFNKIFTGIVLIAEADENAGEKSYAQHLKEEQRQAFTRIAAVLVVPVFTLLACIFAFTNNGPSSTAGIVYTLLTLAGTLAGTLLLWYEVDQYNPALQQICAAGKKVNCGAILHSRASKVFGISWSVIGFTYFAGSLISLLVSNIYNLPILFILSWLNVIALPYIAFSLYYQASVAKQWCVLCLAVQAILALQFITALAGGFHTAITPGSLTAANVLTVAFSFVLPFLIVSLLLPALRKAKESKQSKTALQRLKHDPEIFDALLARQKAITEPTDGLGISIGKPDAKYTLVKVCNPYCGPCAKAHPTIEALIENNTDVRAQIIFTATGEEDDIRTPPVQHLLAIAAKEEEDITKQALDDWYLADKKDYEAFAAKYPMNGELKMQAGKVKAMHEWCNKTEIKFTPMFFVNGYQLPEMYSVADLKYFLSV